MGGNHKPYDFHTQGYLWPPRQSSPWNILGADSSATELHLFPPQWGGPHFSVPKNRHLLWGWIWKHALRRKSGEILELACRNVERLLGREVELENFLNQYAVDICLWSETILNPIASATAQATAGVSTAKLVRRGVVHHSGPVLGLTHLQAPVDRPVKILTAYLSPSHLLIGAKMSACFWRWLTVLLPGDLNTNHVEWNWRLSTRGEFSFVIILLEMVEKECTHHVRIRLGKYLNKKLEKQNNVCAVC